MNNKLVMTILVAAAIGTSSQAGVVTYTPGAPIAIPNTFDGIYLDFTDGLDPSQVTTGFDDTSVPNWDFNLFFGGSAIANSSTLQPVTVGTATNSAVVRLGFGDTVDGTDNYPTSFSGSLGHMGTNSNQWDNGDTGFIGFRVEPSSFSTNAPGGTVYGFMEVTLQNDGTGGEILSWGWDPTGAAVTIPEPGTAGVAAFLFAGVVLTQRRRWRPIGGRA